jgi:hypothetical protein
MRKDMNQIVSLIRDLTELDRLADALIAKEGAKEHKDGRKENRRLTELEKKLILLKQLIAAMLALLTKRPKNKDEAVLMKAQFGRLSKEMMRLLAEIEVLLKEMERAMASWQLGKARRLELFIHAKRQQYSRAA